MIAERIGWTRSIRVLSARVAELRPVYLPPDPAAVGRRVLVRADLDRVQAFCDGELVADHERIWARHQTISDPNHVQAAKLLRRKRISATRPVPEPEVAIRCLEDYDTALGIDLDGGVA